MKIFLNVKTLIIVFLLGLLNFWLNVKLNILIDYKNLSFDHAVTNKVIDHILRSNVNIILLALGVVFLVEINSIFKSGFALNILESQHFKHFSIRVIKIILTSSFLIVSSFITCSLIVPIDINYFLDMFNILGIIASSFTFFLILLIFYLLTFSALHSGLLYLALNVLGKVIDHYLTFLSPFTYGSLITEIRADFEHNFIQWIVLSVILTMINLFLLKHRKYQMCFTIE